MISTTKWFYHMQQTALCSVMHGCDESLMTNSIFVINIWFPWKLSKCPCCNTQIPKQLIEEVKKLRKKVQIHQVMEHLDLRPEWIKEWICYEGQI